MKLFWSMTVIAVLIVVGVLYESGRMPQTGGVAADPQAAGATPKALPVLSQVRATYDLIPGGVHSIEQFRRALWTDAALAAQFPDFDFGKAHFGVVGKDTCAFVSYRVASRFGWTRHCMMLRANEAVLTDGHYTLRVKCGNSISVTPETPLIPEAVQDEMDTGEISPAPESSETSAVPVVPDVPSPGLASSPVGGPAPFPVSPGPIAGPEPFPPFPSPIGGPLPPGGFPFPCIGCPPTGGTTTVTVPDGDQYIGLVAGLVLILAGVYYVSARKRQ
jgi:hypothetical protein